MCVLGLVQHMNTKTGRMSAAILLNIRASLSRRALLLRAVRPIWISGHITSRLAYSAKLMPLLLTLAFMSGENNGPTGADRG